MLTVMISVPAEQAEALARALVEERLAACVQALPIRSVYRWEGEVKEAQEVLLLAKTVGESYHDLEARVRELHPYDVPEIVALPVDRLNPDYQSWLRGELLP